MVTDHEFSAAVFPDIQLNRTVDAVGFGEHGVSCVGACRVRFDPNGVSVVAGDVEQVVVIEGGGFGLRRSGKAQCLPLNEGIPNVCLRCRIHRFVGVLQRAVVGFAGMVEYDGAVGLVHAVMAD